MHESKMSSRVPHNPFGKNLLQISMRYGRRKLRLSEEAPEFQHFLPTRDAREIPRIVGNQPEAKGYALTFTVYLPFPIFSKKEFRLMTIVERFTVRTARTASMISSRVIGPFAFPRIPEIT